MKTIDQTIEQAAKIGREHGTNAAAWWEQDALGGRVTGDTRSTAEAVLKGIEDSDPQVLDGLPYPDLSGQWADGYSSHDLLDELDVNDGDTSFIEGLTDEIFTAYEMAFAEAVESAVTAYAKAALSVEL